MLNVRRAAALAVILAVVGCGGGDRPRLVAVSGKVVHKGQPLTAGSLTFHPTAGGAPASDRPSCQLQEDGSFTAQTYPFGNGMPPGEYKVTLSAALAQRVKLPVYADPAKTPLTLSVPDAGVSGHTFEVK